jgi:endonuclease YncB( thermonuclease family)
MDRDRFWRLVGCIYANGLDVIPNLLERATLGAIRNAPTMQLIFEQEYEAQKDHSGLWAGKGSILSW